MARRRISGKQAALLLTAFTLALAACSRQNEAEPADDGAATSPPERAIPAAPPPSTVPAEAATPAPPPAATGTIPPALRGRWGLVAADCTSAHGDAKGLLEVGVKTLTFYESRATLKSIHAAAPTRLRADYAFSGEGQDWTQDIELRTWNAGAQLIRQDRGPDALPGPLTYTRCAG